MIQTYYAHDPDDYVAYMADEVEQENYPGQVLRTGLSDVLEGARQFFVDFPRGFGLSGN